MDNATRCQYDCHFADLKIYQGKFSRWYAKGAHSPTLIAGGIAGVKVRIDTQGEQAYVVVTKPDGTDIHSKPGPIAQGRAFVTNLTALIARHEATVAEWEMQHATP